MGHLPYDTPQKKTKSIFKSVRPANIPQHQINVQNPLQIQAAALKMKSVKLDFNPNQQNQTEHNLMAKIVKLYINKMQKEEIDRIITKKPRQLFQNIKRANSQTPV